MLQNVNVAINVRNKNQFNTLIEMEGKRIKKFKK